MLYNLAIILAVTALAHASVLSPRGSAAECQAQADACRTKPEANQSFCSAQLSSCIGYNPYTNNTGAATTSSQTPRATCEAVADACRTKPGATQATCSAELAACLGYNPYDSSPSAVYTTEVVTSFTTFCPSPTTLVHGSKTYTITEATTLTITDCPCTITKSSTTATPKPTGSSDDCEAKHAKFQGSGDPNEAQCAAEYAACLGYSPYTSSVRPKPTSNSTQTAHPTTITEIVSSYTTYCPEATTLVHGSKTYTAKASETLTITDCPCTLTKKSASASATSTSCGDAARNACIQAAVNKSEAPNFAECAASSASAEASCPATSGSVQPAAMGRNSGSQIR